MPFIIIKHVKRSNDRIVPVILLDTNHEVLEFSTEDEAKSLAELLEVNSDSGHKYEVKIIK
jgi:hypothetical protein